VSTSGITSQEARIDQAPMLVRASDADAQCRYVNPTWCAFTGRSPADETGEGWTASIHPDDRDAVLTSWMAHFKRRRPLELLYRLRQADGKYRWILERSTPQRTDGEFQGFLHAALDVHERREEESGRAGSVRAFVDEVRTPLQAARVLIELVRRDCEARQTPSGLIFRRLDMQFDRLNQLLNELSAAALGAGPSRRVAGARPLPPPIPIRQAERGANQRGSNRGGA
jgi:PAS domain S-box-containing protein